MKKSARLSAIVKIAEAKERKEAGKLSECRRAAQDKKLKLAELEGFLEEYRNRFMELTRYGVQAEKVRSCHAFICQLNNGITQQQKAVLEAERSVETFRQQWVEAKRRMDILQKAVNNVRLQEAQVEQKKEQSLIDELARRKRQEF